VGRRKERVLVVLKQVGLAMDERVRAILWVWWGGVVGDQRMRRVTSK